MSKPPNYPFHSTQFSRDFSISEDTAIIFIFPNFSDEKLSSEWKDFVYVVYEDCDVRVW